jgi:hypothetical protein
MMQQTKQMKNKLTTAAIILAFTTTSTTLQAADGIFSLGSGIDFSSGKYGAATATDVTYIPFTGKYETESWIFKLTVPYLRITGPGNVIPNIGLAVNASNAVRTDAGLGDVVAATSYSLLNSAQSGTVIDITGKVKFGTADKFKGLGSGANDYAGELSLYKIYGQFSAFGTFGYKVFGQSLGYTLNNAFYGSIGISNKIGDQTSAGLIVDYRQQTSSWGDPQKMWTAFLNRRINNHWKAQTYLFGGAGTSSPDYGGGAMLSKNF